MPSLSLSFSLFHFSACPLSLAPLSGPKASTSLLRPFFLFPTALEKRAQRSRKQLNQFKPPSLTPKSPSPSYPHQTTELSSRGGCEHIIYSTRPRNSGAQQSQSAPSKMLNKTAQVDDICGHGSMCEIESCAKFHYVVKGHFCSLNHINSECREEIKCSKVHVGKSRIIDLLLGELAPSFSFFSLLSPRPVNQSTHPLSLPLSVKNK